MQIRSDSQMAKGNPSLLSYNLRKGCIIVLNTEMIFSFIFEVGFFFISSYLFLRALLVSVSNVGFVEESMVLRQNFAVWQITRQFVPRNSFLSLRKACGEDYLLPKVNMSCSFGSKHNCTSASRHDDIRFKVPFKLYLKFFLRFFPPFIPAFRNFASFNIR